MVVVGLALAGVAALVHVYVFVLESLVWTGFSAAHCRPQPLEDRNQPVQLAR